MHTYHEYLLISVRLFKKISIDKLRKIRFLNKYVCEMDKWNRNTRRETSSFTYACKYVSNPD